MPEEELYHPWGTVSPAFWGAPQTTAAPAQSDLPLGDGIRERLATIADAATGGSLKEAAVLAYELDQEISGELGEMHLDTVRVREVRGYVAFLAEDYPTALGWYLHSLHLCATAQGPGHTETMQLTLRAYSLWRAMPSTADPSRLGTDLLAVVAGIHGPDSAITKRVRAELSTSALTSEPMRG